MHGVDVARVVGIGFQLPAEAADGVVHGARGRLVRARAGDRLYVATGSELRVYDLQGRELVDTLPIPGAVSLGLDEAALIATLRDLPAAELNGANGGHELWALVLEAARLDEVVQQVIATLEFSVLAKYAFSLAQSFNAFYNLHPSRSSILNEERDDVRRWRAAAVIYLRDQLTRALDLMGISVPPRM